MKVAVFKFSSSLSISLKHLNILNYCTLSATFMSALFASRSATVSVWPFSEAIYAGVKSSWIQNYRKPCWIIAHIFMCLNRWLYESCSVKIFKFVVNQFKTFEYFNLLYLIRNIYVRFIRQQQCNGFSVAVFGSYIRWG